MKILQSYIHITTKMWPINVHWKNSKTKKENEKKQRKFKKEKMN